VLAFTINADSLQMAKRLWVEPSVRASLVSQARNTTSRTPEETNPTKELESLPVPLGWHLTTNPDDPQAFPFYAKWSVTWALVSKLVGLLLTAVAISFGAPFWFDTLSKLARLRNSGAPPPASDAVRRGEGEETRRGESAALATALLEARGRSAETATPEEEATATEAAARGEPARQPTRRRRRPRDVPPG
jgi:hypothetical protein